MNPKIITALYDVALEPEKWSDVLGLIHPLVNASSAGLLICERTADEYGVLHQFARASELLNNEHLPIYNQNYAHLEHYHVNKVFQSTPGTVVLDENFDDREKMLTRPDVAYALKSWGILDRFGVRLNDDEAWVDCLAFQYPPDRSNVTNKEFSNFAPYIPHLAQTVSLGRMYESIRRKYQAVLTVLDKIDLGILLLRDDGTIILCNEYGRKTIDSSPHIDITSAGKLHAKDQFTDLRLRESVVEICSSANGNGSVAKSYVALGTDVSSDNLLIELSPLSDVEYEIEAGFKGALAILVDPNRVHRIQPDVFKSLYGLTKAESDVATLLSDGNSYEHVAQIRDVGKDTIKSQVSSIYSKMKTDSRAGFFRRLISITLPFVD